MNFSVVVLVMFSCLSISLNFFNTEAKWAFYSHFHISAQVSPIEELNHDSTVGSFYKKLEEIIDTIEKQNDTIIIQTERLEQLDVELEVLKRTLSEICGSLDKVQTI